MPTDSSNSLKIQREKRILLAEVSDTEKRLWACIHSKGVLHNDAKDLYHKACCVHEKLFLNENELPELQNIEYLLWRLHYKHIDEFRKIISQSSTKGEVKLSANSQKQAANKDVVGAHLEGFRSFLSEASKFYQGLIRKIKGFYGLLDEPWFYKNGVAGRIEQTELHKCQFVCHRLCICLGDLARYQELYGKPNNQQRNWSVAASYYLEAAKIYPDGGNPQNQLAVLATYIGDEFLALYHCIRSLAVKEPFQDALQNLILLFERNRSIHLVSHPYEVYDFSKPSEWISSPSKAASGNRPLLNKKTPSKIAEHNLSMLTDLCTLFIRTTSFFFLDSSLDNFPSTFNSTVRQLEELFALDVSELSSALESYRNMNLSKAGPYRALHIISVLIFIIHYLTKDPEQKILKPKNEMHQSTLVKLALTVTFMFMGRFVDRCLKGTVVIYFPLLPALLVFVEWLVGSIDEVDVKDEKCDSARCYFFRSFVDLLNQLQESRTHIPCSDHIALWEDYELRGFIPLSHAHVLLDFSSHWEEEINYKMKNEHRARRIVQAAIKIANKSGAGSRKWLFYDDLNRKFSDKPAVVEEEEDIVFKPITRHNSEPIQMDQPKTEAPDECLRRASSLLIAQSLPLINPLSSPPPTLSPSSIKQPGQNEHLMKGGSSANTFSEGPVAAGPPSLSSWVLNGENSSTKSKNKDANRSVLKPIQEVSSDDLMKSLSLSTSDNSGAVSPRASPFYCPPSPSSPLSPNSGVWFINNAATPQPVNYSSYPPDISQASPILPSFFDHSSPWGGPQLPKLGNHKWSPPNHVIREQSASRNFNDVTNSETSTTLYPDGGPPLFLPSPSLLHGLQDHCQRVKPYSSPGMTESRPEPQPLLRYLKEREWQLQQEPPFTGSPYM